jgi:hypothetical protein
LKILSDVITSILRVVEFVPTGALNCLFLCKNSPSCQLKNLRKKIRNAFAFSGKSLVLGGAAYAGQPVPGLTVSIPLAMVNRHGLIAGATGTGKTKSVQHLAESLSDAGVSVLLMDIKGDISGLAKPGCENPKITSRMTSIGQPWSPAAYPVELMTISNEKGVRLRATVTEFGPVLFSKMLELNETSREQSLLSFNIATTTGGRSWT